MTINNRQDYVIIDLINQAVRNVRAQPVNLGGVSGVGGGEGTPPGGFIGLLAQTKVAYDSTEASYLGILSAPSGTLVDNLAHIRYRLDVLEASGVGGTALTVDDWDGSPTITYVNHITFSGGAVVTNLGGGHALVEITASGGGGGGDSTYLRLDTTNDPLVGEIQIIPTTVGENGIYVETQGDAYTADFEQYTTNIDITSQAIFSYRETNGTGNIAVPMVELLQSQSGTGTITGDFLSLEDDSGVRFNVDANGNAYSNGSLLITEAPVDGNAYGRQDGGWVVVSGAGGSSLTVKDYSGTPTINNVDTIIFSGAYVTNLGGGDVLVEVSSGAGGGSTSPDLYDPYGLHHRLSGSNSDDDEFSSNTLGSWTGLTPSGSVTWAIENHCLSAIYSNTTGNHAICKLKAITMADGDWIETLIRGITTQSNYTMYGLLLADGNSVSSNAVALTCYQSTTAGEITFRLDTGAINGFTGTQLSQTVKSDVMAGGLRLKFKRNSSTAYKWYVAPLSGTPFYDWGTSTYNIGFTPTYAGVWVSTWGHAHSAIASFDYFRHMS